jgi:hypothetical protein
MFGKIEYQAGDGRHDEADGPSSHFPALFFSQAGKKLSTRALVERKRGGGTNVKGHIG